MSTKTDKTVERLVPPPPPPPPPPFPKWLPYSCLMKEDEDDDDDDEDDDEEVDEEILMECPSPKAVNLRK